LTRQLKRQKKKVSTKTTIDWWEPKRKAIGGGKKERKSVEPCTKTRKEKRAVSARNR
jgi:hypothetical protein